VADEVVLLVGELGITSVLDAACGDGFWMPDLPGYIGVDIAPEATATSRRRHPHRRYLTGDVATLKLPTCDLVVTRDAMQHLSWADGTAFLSALIATGPKYLLASHYIGGENIDIETGGAYSPDLTAYPFWLPEPDRLIFDGYYYHRHDTDAVRDPRKHLALWSLRG